MVMTLGAALVHGEPVMAVNPAVVAVIGGTIAVTSLGIPAEHLLHLCTRFYRVDKPRSRAGGGSGIGLTVVKHLIEAHDGRVWAESKGAG